MNEKQQTTTTARVGRRALLGGSLATAFTVIGGGAWALDRYVIDHVEVANASAQTSAVTAVEAATDGTTSANGYTSDTATVTVSTHTLGSGSDLVTYYVAEVTVANTTVLKSAFANDQFGQNIIANPSEISAEAGAVLAINGDYYGFRDNGIVVRNGVAYRDAGARQGLLLTTDGLLSLYDETSTTAAELIDKGAWQTWSFGPGLVDDGAVLDGIDTVEVDTNFGNHSVQGNQPRTGIGMIKANHFLFIAVDGRSTGYSRGVSMTEMAEIFVNHGATVAYNLDGGGSTTMVFTGDLVNNPLGKGEERGTSDIIFIAG